MLRSEKRVRTSTSTARFFFLNPLFNKTCGGQVKTNNIQTYVRRNHGDPGVSADKLHNLPARGSEDQRERGNVDGIPSRPPASSHPHLLRTSRSLVKRTAVHNKAELSKSSAFFLFKIFLSLHLFEDLHNLRLRQRNPRRSI